MLKAGVTVLYLHVYINVMLLTTLIMFDNVLVMLQHFLHLQTIRDYHQYLLPLTNLFIRVLITCFEVYVVKFRIWNLGFWLHLY